MHVSSLWGIEVSEMHVHNMAEVEAWKDFQTSTFEKFRPPYAKLEVFYPRQCVFAGSTNQPFYLKDVTGNRRQWPVKCGTIDIDALRRDRDQLWAEAVVMYDKGAKWWPDREFEKQFINPVQESRRQVDEWENLIRQHAWTHLNINPRKTTITELYQYAIGAGVLRPLSNSDTQRISKVLIALRATMTRSNGIRWWDLGNKPP